MFTVHKISVTRDFSSIDYRVYEIVACFEYMRQTIEDLEILSDLYFRKLDGTKSSST